MIIKNLVDEDFSNYKKPSMFIAFPYCSFKCEKDCGEKVCQNGELATSPNIEISTDKIVNRYLENNLTSAIVCGGLEPFDSWNDLYNLIQVFRQKTDNDIVIYTGYYKKEIEDKIKELGTYKNIIIKYGRYIPNEKNVYNKLLGVKLASKNQYAERVN
ncbi:MAG: 4Fe-4S cluster-binding domain-containing protein [Bacilli bacterium]